ncbi:glycosyltransferase family protein [Altererythrobacter sp. Z27]|uniref:glycosyltransferase family protein n=1 Tax=Altererythrobacter sp. Z27 TaxID=3461147 RepID=UPI004044D930
MANRRSVLLSSNCNVWKEPFNSQSYALLQVLSSIEDAQIVLPEAMPHLAQHAVRPSIRFLASELTRRLQSQLLVAAGRIGARSCVPVTIDRNFDLLFFSCQFPIELSTLENLKGWRERCGFVAVYLMETWSYSLEQMAPYLRLLDKVDHVFVLHGQSIPNLRKYTSTPISKLPTAVDCHQATPLRYQPDRSIDVYNFGRRAPLIHADLIERGRNDPSFHYVFDSIQGGIVQDWREHRKLCAEQMKRAKFFLAFNPRDIGAANGKAHNEQALATRYFEGAAGGAVMLGTKPRIDDFETHFDWPDALIELRPDGDVCALFDSIMSDPDRMARISRRNAAESLRRHDWAHRWSQVLDVLGMDRTAQHDERIAELAELADTAS